MRWPWCEVARWPDGQVARWLGGQVARCPGGHGVRWPGGPTRLWPIIRVRELFYEVEEVAKGHLATWPDQGD